MNILSIETSCDETGVSVVEVNGAFPHALYTIKGNALFSQAKLHEAYGGVFPNLAKREHAKALTPLLRLALTEAGCSVTTSPSATFSKELMEQVKEVLAREEGLYDDLVSLAKSIEKPHINLIAVTTGPGLEPALWVGISFARALSLLWNIPIVSVNHMEGHILSSVFDGSILSEIAFPAIALLISGGHTELILMTDWNDYTKIGETRDDAVGEAFDKTARMLELPYPGGPHVSHLARHAREKDCAQYATLPRPMIDSDTLDFSFSGLKTAVRYAIGEKKLNDNEKASLAREFEDAVTEVLLKKTKKAIEEYDAQSVIVGGGVSANTHIRETFFTHLKKAYPMLTVYFPTPSLSTDNGVMIALSGHARMKEARSAKESSILKAEGHVSL